MLREVIESALLIPEVIQEEDFNYQYEVYLRNSPHLPTKFILHTDNHHAISPMDMDILAINR